ncbi:MAG: ATP-binding protein [Anaerolineales bacterium]|nr:ATP-binding protein [Anaerolineales bacterium]
MIVAVASGKGGTGKTTIAASLALSLAAGGGPAPLFLDCDVEAPNAHLFLQPDLQEQRDVTLLIPQVNEDLCSHCGRCAEVCQYHAIAVLGEKTLVFPQLCHGCGSCSALCPEQAISEVPARLGVIERGPARDGIAFARGVLDIGQPMAVPLIRDLKAWARPGPGQHVIVDCPPGASCPVVAALRGVDFLLLVTEPTPFGLHDLRQAAAIATELGLPAAVIINRVEGSFPDLETFCRDSDLPILLRIPFERAIAAGIARGQNLIEIRPVYRERLADVFSKLNKNVQEGRS